MKNIAFVGGMGSGKTSAANFLVKKYGYRKESLASPIKFYINDILGIDKTNSEFREIAQGLGSFFRKYNPDCWTEYFLKTMGLGPIVIDDVRFENEIKLLLKKDFRIIYLHCSPEIRVERCLARDGVFDRKSLYHESELSSAMIPYVDEFFESESAGRSKTVMSNMDLESFLVRIDEVYKKLL
jgi:thymidylate kinase